MNFIAHYIGQTIKDIAYLSDKVVLQFENGDLLEIATYCGCRVCTRDRPILGNPDNGDDFALLVADE